MSEEVLPGRRLKRERKTLLAMIRIFCRDQHQSGPALCADCEALLDYATLRLARCRFREHKPTCAHCTVHCYQAKWREQVKAVMRYAGPRMIWRHPLLSLYHLRDGLRKTPQA